MAYTGKPRKINVRSPYFVTVAKAPSKVVETDIDPTEGEEPATPITEPIVTTESLECGATKNINGSVGTLKFNIDITGKTVAEHAVAFSNVRVPIKYRLGFAGNMPSFSTAGLDTYADQWEEATTETPTLTVTTSSNLISGISFNATFTPTQNDIDTYGNTIQLEILQPLPTQSYSITANCSANASVPAASDSVILISVSSLENNPSTTAKLNINGSDIDADALYSAPSVKEPARRYLTDLTTYLPVNGDGFTNINNMRFFNIPSESGIGSRNYFKADGTSAKSSVEYISPSTLTSNTNTLTLEQTSSGDQESQNAFQITISKHQVNTSNNTILGNADGVDFPLLQINHVLRGKGSTLTFQFEGSNEKDLLAGIASLETPALEDIGQRPIETVEVKTLTYKAL
jgi:hypothetical protein